ncbi:hypothetical protein Mgra_00008688 [Meloidogyne graminicola]|uniref:Uncharacterized protein n=1 Tax=Meloidogyne graminicola TaxID=189291 RepID=A0A8S9ZF68_9BILA|nr:hypothetical protein Mgra_00008688 [Meloidogyne graminicola]
MLKLKKNNNLFLIILIIYFLNQIFVNSKLNEIKRLKRGITFQQFLKGYKRVKTLTEDCTILLFCSIGTGIAIAEGQNYFYPKEKINLLIKENKESEPKIIKKEEKIKLFNRNNQHLYSEIVKFNLLKYKQFNEITKQNFIKKNNKRKLSDGLPTNLTDDENEWKEN